MGRTNRQIDAILAAKAEAYTLMLAACENDGLWTCHQFADSAAASLARETCEHEGFEVRPPSSDYPNTVAVRTM
jgi:hypothetical protein